jgi:hypothetical protein
LERFEFKSGIVSFCFFLSLFHLENCISLSHGRIVIGVGDLVQRTGDGRTGWVLGGRAIERLGGTVCSLHRACGDEECRFLG